MSRRGLSRPGAWPHGRSAESGGYALEQVGAKDGQYDAGRGGGKLLKLRQRFCRKRPTRASTGGPRLAGIVVIGGYRILPRRRRSGGRGRAETSSQSRRIQLPRTKRRPRQQRVRTLDGIILPQRVSAVAAREGRGELLGIRNGCKEHCRNQKKSLAHSSAFF